MMNDDLKKHGSLSWSELLVDDVESALAFYTEVIGWDIEEVDMPQCKYYLLKVEDKPVAGIMAKPEGYEEVPNHWGIYITVDDVDQTLEKAILAGGKAIYPPMDVEGVGRMCAIMDKVGAVISVITYEEEL